LVKKVWSRNLAGFFAGLADEACFDEGLGLGLGTLGLGLGTLGLGPWDLALGLVVVPAAKMPHRTNFWSLSLASLEQFV
jgi:hypothetical protein